MIQAPTITCPRNLSGTLAVPRFGRFRFKAIRRYRAAHDDIVGAMSKKEKALQQLFKKADPFLLQEIAQEALESSGTGIYRQEKRDGGAGVDPEANSFGTTVGGQTRSPEQLRDEFSQTLKVGIYEWACAIRVCQVFAVFPWRAP